MKTPYKITDKQLAFLESYIKKKKRYTNPEDTFELIDHIILDFEATTKTGNLSQYLSDNSYFIHAYKSSSTVKADVMHWQYQKELFKEFFKLFYKLKYMPITYLSILFFYVLFVDLNLTNKFVGLLFLFFIITPSIVSFFLTYHKSKKIKKLISFKHLFNIMGWPHLFLYLTVYIINFLQANRILFFIYAFSVVALHIAGVLVTIKKRHVILEKHKHLLD